MSTTPPHPVAMPLAQVIAELAIAHEAMLTRGAARTAEEKADYERLMNRVAAEVMWLMAARTAFEVDADGYGYDVVEHADTLTRLEATAPRLIKGIYSRIAEMPLERRIKIMEQSQHWPR